VTRAVLYARVSSSLQERDGCSLDAQKALARDYCTRRGWDLVEEVVDVMSGSKADRPGLARVEAMVKRRAVDVVLVYKIDRLSRDAAHYLQLLQDFARHDVGLSSLTQDLDTTTTMGRFVLRILIIVAEMEAENTADRVRDNIRFRAAQGRILAGKHAPFGYRYVKARTDPDGTKHPGRLEVDEDEAATVRRLFELFLAKRSVLGAMKAATAEGRTSRDGKPLWRNTVYTILRNPAYMGVMRQLRSRRVNRGGRKVAVATRPDEWVEGPAPWPALVDRATWEAAQAVLDGNAGVPSRAIASREVSMWPMLVRCGSCGRSMSRILVNRKRGDPTVRIICATRADGGPVGCDRPASVSERWMDLAVAPRILEALAPLATRGEAPAKPKARKKADPAAALARVERQREAVRKQHEWGAITDDQARARFAELSAEAARLVAPEPEADAPPLPRDLAGAWPTMSPAERNMVLSVVLRHVRIDGTDTATVCFRPSADPDWPEDFTLEVTDLRTRAGKALGGR